MTDEINIGLPHVHYFVPSAAPATYLLVGPDHEIAKTCFTTAVADATNGGYVLTITPDECGTWTLIVKDAGDAVVHTAQWEAVRATSKEVALGVSRPSLAPVTVFPDRIHGDYRTVIRNYGPGTYIRCWANTGKNVIPYNGRVWGVNFWYNNIGPTNFPAMVSVKCATVDPTTTLVRSISENFKDSVAWDDQAWNTITFTKPLLAKAGDWLVWEIDDSDTDPETHYHISLDDPVAGMTVESFRYKTGALSLTAANTFLEYGSTYNKSVIKQKFIMDPPHIAIAGHSIWAGYPGGAPIWDTSRAYVRAYDIAAMLGDMLGLGVVNCSLSSTGLAGWVPTNGFFEAIVPALRPSVLIYDTAYNDSAIDDDDYVGYLDKLLAQCARYGIELVMIEAPGSYYAVNAVTPTIDSLRNKRAIVSGWCQQHGIACIPTEFLMGMHSGGTEHMSERNYQKRITSPTLTYDAGDGDSRVHLSLSGLTAFAYGALVPFFRHRRNVEPRWRRAGIEYAAVDSPVSPLVQIVDDSTIPAAVAALATDVYDAQHDVSRGDSTDEHRVTWYKNGARQTTVTSPTTAIYDNAGDALLTATAMTDLGSGDLLYVATGANRMTVGESYRIVDTATIDGSSRTWATLVSRDIGGGIGTITIAISDDDIDPPAAAGLTTGYLLCLGTNGAAEPGVTIVAEMVDGPGTAGLALDRGTITMVSDGSGLAQHTGFVRGATYRFKRGSDRWWGDPQVAASTATWAIGEIVGKA